MCRKIFDCLDESWVTQIQLGFHRNEFWSRFWFRFSGFYEKSVSKVLNSNWIEYIFQRRKVLCATLAPHLSSGRQPTSRASKRNFSFTKYLWHHIANKLDTIQVPKIRPNLLQVFNSKQIQKNCQIMWIVRTAIKFIFVCVCRRSRFPTNCEFDESVQRWLPHIQLTSITHHIITTFDIPIRVHIQTTSKERIWCKDVWSIQWF